MRQFFKYCKEYARLGLLQFLFILVLAVTALTGVAFLIYGFIMAPLPFIIILLGAFLLSGLGNFSEWLLKRRSKDETTHTPPSGNSGISRPERAHYEQ